jgi:hypothetical protein
VRRDLERDRLELRRLVAQHDEVDPLGQLRVRRDGLAPDLGGERLRAREVDVGAQHRLTPAERHAPGHGARSDEADLHADAD